MPAIQLHEEAIGPAQIPVTQIKRPSRWGWWVAFALVASVIAVLLYWPSEGGRAPTYITEAATVGDLEEVVEGTGIVGFSDGDTVALTARVGGTITDVHLVEGATIAPMEPVVDVDGQTVWVVTGESPVYRDLSVDSEGEDVQTLEESLRAVGYDPGEIDEVFDGDTQTALEEWQEDNDLEVTGRFGIVSFVWAPSDFIALDVTASRGAFLQAGDSVVTAGLADVHVVRAIIDQAEVTSVEVGDEARIEIDGIDGVLAGAVTSISPIPVEGSDFEVVVSMEEEERVLAGMEASVRIVVDTLRDVVLIPTGALGGSESAATVDVLVDGMPETRPITIGLMTPTKVEVTSGLSKGDQLVIGEATE